MSQSRVHWIVDFIAFQALWFSAVVFQAPLVCFGILSARLLLSEKTAYEVFLLISLAPVGIVIDWSLMQAGVFQFNLGMFPLWLALLWGGFILTLNQSMGWLRDRHLGVQALLGAIFGPMSYLAGWRFDAVGFGFALIPTLIGLGLLWGFLLPSLVLLQQRLIRWRRLLGY